MSLRSILGGSRIKKKKPASTPRASPSSSTSSSWSASLPRTKPGNQRQSSTKRAGDDDDDDVAAEDYFGSKLDDAGLVTILATDPSLRDVPQAIRHIATHMFDAVPDRGARTGAVGLSSTQVSSILRFRAALPPVATVGHVAALLGNPTAAEREAAELARAGVVRRVVVPHRAGGIGEVLVLTAALEDMIARSSLDEPTREAFRRWLRQNPVAQTVPYAGTGTGSGWDLDSRQVDALVRAGFLTAQLDGGGSSSMFARPEDRHTMLSLETVARAAAGSMAAVGGDGAVVAAGGSGAGGGGGGGGGIGAASHVGTMRLALPGNGAFLKLVSLALEHLAALLERTPYREMPETDLRERWDGGIVGNRTAARAKLVRGEFVGALPGRTRKWRAFHGLSFAFILREAVGAGWVEVFETRSVGRGIRLV